MRAYKKWSNREIAQVLARFPHEKTVALAADLGVSPLQLHNKAQSLGIRKSPEFLSAIQAETIAKLKEAGKRSRFRRGIVPWNKGISIEAGGRSSKTRFKKGEKPHTWAPLGSERVSKDGYLQRKITDTGYPPRDWVAVHHIVWQEAGNGPVPKGHALTFKDGDKRNTTLGNLELISRRELMHRNSVHNCGPEIAQLHQLQGAITRQINKRKGKSE